MLAGRVCLAGRLPRGRIDRCRRVWSPRATHSSLLLVPKREEHLEGTPDGHEILPGYDREGLIYALTAAAREFRRSTCVTLPALIASEEVILVGTTYEVLPVIEIDGKTVGSGTPGPVARRLVAVYRRRWSAAIWQGQPTLRRHFVYASARIPGWSSNDDDRGTRRPPSIQSQRETRFSTSGIRVVLSDQLVGRDRGKTIHRAVGRAGIGGRLGGQWKKRVI